MAMNGSNALPSERVAVCGVLAPVSGSAATHDLDNWVPVKNFRRFMAVVQAGVLGASATIDAQIRTSTDLVGGGAALLSGASITQMVKATDDNKTAVLNLDCASLANTVKSISLRVTVGANASLVSAVLLGFDGYAEPASDHQSANMVATVSK